MIHTLTSMRTGMITTDGANSTIMETKTPCSITAARYGDFHNHGNIIHQGKDEKHETSTDDTCFKYAYRFNRERIYEFNEFHSISPKSMVAGAGFEPTIPDSDSGVLPLHYPAILKV